MLTTRKSS